MNKLDITKREIAHLGVILSNLSVVSLVLTITNLLGLILIPLFYILYYLLLFCSTVFTLGLLLLSEEYRALYTMDFNINHILEILKESFPILGITTLVLLVVALVLLLFDAKWISAKSRILYICIVLGIVVVISLIFIIGVIGGAK